MFGFVKKREVELLKMQIADLQSQLLYLQQKFTQDWLQESQLTDRQYQELNASRSKMREDIRWIQLQLHSMPKTADTKILHYHELMLAAAVELACARALPTESAMLLDIISRYRQDIVDLGKPPKPPAPPAPSLNKSEVDALVAQFRMAPAPTPTQEPTPTPTEESPTNESL